MVQWGSTWIPDTYWLSIHTPGRSRSCLACHAPPSPTRPRSAAAYGPIGSRPPRRATRRPSTGSSGLSSPPLFLQHSRGSQACGFNEPEIARVGDQRFLDIQVVSEIDESCRPSRFLPPSRLHTRRQSWSGCVLTGSAPWGRHLPRSFLAAPSIRLDAVRCAIPSEPRRGSKPVRHSQALQRLADDSDHLSIEQERTARMPFFNQGLKRQGRTF